jgi:hypothetical protein
VPNNASRFTFTYPRLEVPMHNHKKNFNWLQTVCSINDFWELIKFDPRLIDDMSQILNISGK